MSITAEQERRYYDAVYSAFLEVPDEELPCTRATLLADLANPRKTIWERRRLHRRVLDYLLAQPLGGLQVLDYGCGTGDWGLMLAHEGANVTLLDLSPKAIELGLKRARAAGTADRVRGIACDASDLRAFVDGSFDLVYASAALHHTLKYAGALEELIRVIKPGGLLVLAETMGNNPVLNLARRVRARLAGQSEDAGEEIILDQHEIERLRGAFSALDVYPMNLLAMGKRLFRGRFHISPVRWAVYLLEAADAVALTVAPVLARYCGEVMIIARK